MLTLVLAILVGLGISWYFYTPDKPWHPRPPREYAVERDSIETAEMLLAGFFVGAALGIGLLLNIREREAPIPLAPMSLVSMRDAAGISGDFFLGCGSINNNLSYIYYIRESDGGIVGRINGAQAVRIYEDEVEQPYSLPYSCEGRLGVWRGSVCAKEDIDRIDFHIPPNSVLANYSIGGAK